MLPILEIWFTPSGVAVTCLLVLLTLFLCAFFVPSAQALIRQFLEKGVRGKWGSGEIELGRPTTLKPADNLPAGEAAPTPPKDIDFPELPTSEIRPQPVDGDHPNSESALRIDMIVASFDRDHQALEKAYNTLMSLPDRRETDESLTTEKLSLEHRMGDESAVPKLVCLADTNPDWYEPSQSLAYIYYSLDSYDKASAHLKTAMNRAQDDEQKIRSLLLDARIREQTEGRSAAIQFTKAMLLEFSEQQYQAQIWKRVAELHWSGGEKIPSFIAAEIALQMQPLDKDLRSQLAYRYADNETTKAAAYYHYNKLRDQDERHPHCLNNMAIILQGLDMPVGYVRLLKRAKEFDQPYPHGNLAITLARAGFLDEARAMIEELPEKFRIESRAAEAVNFIARRQNFEKERLKKLEDASELFHKIYLTAAVNVNEGRIIEINSVVGTWTSDSCTLSLEQGEVPLSLVGTLTRASNEYNVKLNLIDNLMSGTARKKGESFGLLTGSTTPNLLLTWEGGGEMAGLIYTDEMDPSEVTLLRQG